MYSLTTIIDYGLVAWLFFFFFFFKTALALYITSIDVFSIPTSFWSFFLVLVFVNCIALYIRLLSKWCLGFFFPSFYRFTTTNETIVLCFFCCCWWCCCFFYCFDWSLSYSPKIFFCCLFFFWILLLSTSYCSGRSSPFLFCCFVAFCLFWLCLVIYQRLVQQYVLAKFILCHATESGDVGSFCFGYSRVNHQYSEHCFCYVLYVWWILRTHQPLQERERIRYK